MTTDKIVPIIFGAISILLIVVGLHMQANADIIQAKQTVNITGMCLILSNDTKACIPTVPIPLLPNDVQIAPLNKTSDPLCKQDCGASDYGFLQI